MKRYFRFTIFPLIIFFTIILFKDYLDYYFFQDDWFVLSIVKNIKFLEIFHIFAIRADVIYYRPIGMQLFFYLGYALFGLQPIGYHLISFTFHIVNIFLVGLISYQIFKNKTASAISSFLYAIAPFHFMTFAWLSLTWVNIGTLFVFLSIYSFIKYFKFMNIKFYIMAFITFLLAIFTTEFAITIPFISLVLSLFEGSVNSKNIKKISSSLILLVLIISVYSAIRLVTSNTQTTGDYKITLNPIILKNIFWYFLWFLGIPFEMKYNIVLSILKFSPIFMNSVGNLILPIFVIWIAFILFITISIFNNLGKVISKLSIGSIIIFLLGLAPVIFIPYHTFPYYLNAGSLGFIILFGLVISNFSYKSKKYNTLLIAATLTCWIIVVHVNLLIANKTNWIPGEAAISREISNKIYPAHKKNIKNLSVLIISPDNNKTKQALMDQNAMRIVLNNPAVKTYYEKESLIADYKKGIIKPGDNIQVIFNE